MISNSTQTVAVPELGLVYQLVSWINLLTTVTTQQLPQQVQHSGRHAVLQDVITDALECKKQSTFSSIAANQKPAALATAGQLCVQACCLTT